MGSSSRYICYWLLIQRRYLQDHPSPCNIVSMACTSIKIVLNLCWWSLLFFMKLYISSTGRICLESHPFYALIFASMFTWIFFPGYSITQTLCINIPLFFNNSITWPLSVDIPWFSLNNSIIQPLCIDIPCFSPDNSITLTISINIPIFPPDYSIARPVFIKILLFSPNYSITWYLGIDIPHVYSYNSITWPLCINIPQFLLEVCITWLLCINILQYFTDNCITQHPCISIPVYSIKI